MQYRYILIVDHMIERQQALVEILTQLKTSQPEMPDIKICPTPKDAIAFSSEHDCPIVFTAVDLPGMNGFAMIEQIRSQNSRTNFILLADCKEYIIQALTMKLRLSGSVMGMPDAECIQDELDSLWYPLSS